MSKLPHATPVVTEDEEDESKVSWRDDVPALFVLVVLYALQGIPLGLIFGSLPFYLSERLSFSDVALFSLSSYPYSLKLFWSPIVDSLWIPQCGRRKTWIIPLQTAMALLLLFLSSRLSFWLDTGQNPAANVPTMTAWFFALIFLTATQDIAVDGWALTILKHGNKHYQSTCQSFGQTLGFAISFPLFLALNSADVCRKYFGSDGALLSLDEMMYYCGIATLCVNVIVAFFVRERAPMASEKLHSMTVAGAYSDMCSVATIKPVLCLCFVLVTCRMPFSCVDSATQLRLNQKGYPKEIAGALVFINTPFDLLWPVLVTSLMHRFHTQPLTAWRIGFVMRLCASSLSVALVYLFESPQTLDSNLFVAFNLFVLLFYSFCSSVMFTSQCMFFANIADARIGGTYLTLVNTVANLGGMWPKYFVLRAIDYLTVTEERMITPRNPWPGNDASQPILKERVTVNDGYFTVAAVCACVGILWIVSMNSAVRKLQLLKPSAWKVPRRLVTKKNH